MGILSLNPSLYKQIYDKLHYQNPNYSTSRSYDPAHDISDENES